MHAAFVGAYTARAVGRIVFAGGGKNGAAPTLQQRGEKLLDLG